RRDVCERFVAFQEFRGEIEKPRPHDAAMAPHFADRSEVEREFALALEYGETFGERLHHPVFDAVVDHLHEMSRALRTAMEPTGGGRGRDFFEKGLDLARAFNPPPVHERLAFVESPYAAGDAAVDKANQAFGKPPPATLQTLVKRIPAVDGNITRRE